MRKNKYIYLISDIIYTEFDMDIIKRVSSFIRGMNILNNFTNSKYMCTSQDNWIGCISTSRIHIQMKCFKSIFIRV